MNKLKRAFDMALSLIVIVVALPLWVAVALAIRLDSPGPIFHRATRIGRGGNTITIHKFRSMVAGSCRDAPGITRSGDPRITRVGRLLRRVKIDETPQLIDVLRGEMSIVGPRPEDPRYVAHYTPEQYRVLTVLPGMTSPATIKYSREEDLLDAAGDDFEQTYVRQILPDKLRLDLEYVEQQSFLGDLAILARAAVQLIGGTRASVDAGP